jgi:hydroxymethylpyrimidine kinase/phosphomethylpyrimidine kinase
MKESGRMIKTLLSIAGFDPSGGAGVLADLRVFHDLGFHGAAALTGLTIQTTTAVLGVEPVRTPILSAQVEALDADLAVAGIKVGMAATEANLREIGRLCAARPGIPRVIDPVFRASSGRPLLDRKGRAAFVSALRGRATVITPNLDEAGLLAGSRIESIEGMIEAARSIARTMGFPCLVKGGHLEGDAVNVLHDAKRTYVFGRPRLKKDVHGTGCIFSAALTAFLAKGKSLAAASALATDFTHDSIARSVRVGRGRRVRP